MSKKRDSNIVLLVQSRLRYCKGKVEGPMKENLLQASTEAHASIAVCIDKVDTISVDDAIKITDFLAESLLPEELQKTLLSKLNALTSPAAPYCVICPIRAYK